MQKIDESKRGLPGFGHLKKYIKNLSNNLSLQKRIMISFSLLIIAALSIIGIISYNVFSHYTQNMVIKQRMKIGNSVVEEIHDMKQRDEKISDQLLMNKYLQTSLNNTHFEDDYDKLQKYQLVNSLLYSMVDRNNAISIYIAGSNGQEYKSHADNMSSIRRMAGWQTSRVYKEAMEGNGKNMWIPMVGNIYQVLPDSSAKTPFLYIVRKMRNPDNIRQVLGISVIQLNYYRMHNIISRMATGSGEYSVLAANDGTIMSHTRDISQIGSKLDSQIMKQSARNEDGYFFTGKEAGKQLVIYNKYRNMNWYVVQFIPYKNIMSNSREIGTYTALTLMIGLMLSIFVSMVISKSITTPIIHLKNIMNEFGKGRLLVRTNINRNDEIGKLEESFNHMAGDIKSLMGRIEDEHKRSRKLELNMIEYQINPHFLYNTLDSINWMAQKSGQKDIGEMVTNLARFFRIGLSKGQDFTKLADELEHARSYLNILKIRYRDCFTYEILADSNILNHKTIKIILQPIIENAIKHGIYKDRTDGTIRISGRTETDCIILEVKDNGRGIEQDKLKSLQDVLERAQEDDTIDIGFGLLNVNERIKLNFGMQYGLHIDSIMDEGTTVTVKLPIID
jgi:two-component system sensor histidine kinase YesM